jgi:hypothetical protein
MDYDAFISYAHLDNVELIEGRKGWVANLHRALEVRVAQLLGKQPQIWRDPKLQGNDLFAEALVERLRRVGALISVVSPRYIKSDWARRELFEFCKAVEEQGGIRLRDKARVFKVMKTPVPLESQTPELQSLLGYEFFKVDPETGRIRELDEIFGPEAQREFWIRLDDLAHDICRVLEMLETKAGSPPQTEKKAVYLAETTRDLKEQREAIRRDLLQHGHAVFPARPLPFEGPELRQAVREEMAQCGMSIHPVGKNYSLVPEGDTQSLVEIQNELAIERGQAGDGFARLLWIPSGLEIEDQRQHAVIERLRTDPRLQEGADLLETSLEELRTVFQDWLKRGEKQESRSEDSVAPVRAQGVTQLFLIYDQRDIDVIAPWADFLFEQKIELLHPIFDGDEADIREYYEENLRTCDGVMIFYGSANELWLRRKLRELLKSAGYGRTKTMRAVGICMIPPKTPEKERFRTHEAIVVPQFEGLAPAGLSAFVETLSRPPSASLPISVGEERRQAPGEGLRHD